MTTNKITESIIEEFATNLCERRGYQYIYAPGIAPDSETPEIRNMLNKLWFYTSSSAFICVYLRLIKEIASKINRGWTRINADDHTILSRYEIRSYEDVLLVERLKKSSWHDQFRHSSRCRVKFRKIGIRSVTDVRQ